MLSYTAQPSFNQSPQHSRPAIFPQKKRSRDANHFIGDVTRPAGTCFSLHYLKNGEAWELMVSPDCKSCQEARCRNSPLACGSVAVWIPVWGMAGTVHLDGSQRRPTV